MARRGGKARSVKGEMETWKRGVNLRKEMIAQGKSYNTRKRQVEER